MGDDLVQSSTTPPRPMPDQSAQPGSPNEPAWRFVEFFFTVPWSIAWPENDFAVVSRDETLDWMPVELERLAQFLPESVAKGVIARGNNNFVAFQFRRFPIEHDSPYDRFDAVHTLAQYATFPAVAIAVADDPIHHRRHTSRIETYETIVRAATCLIDDATGKLGKAEQDAFDRCLDEFAVLMESYAQTAKDLRSGVVTRASVAFPLVPAVLFDPVSGDKELDGVQAGENFPLSNPVPVELDQPKLHEVLIRSELTKRGEPYPGIRLWQRIARRSCLIEGEFALSVVAAHTAGEMLFDSFLLRMGWEEITFGPPGTLTREQVIKWFSWPNTLKTRLCGFYHIRLQGHWACGSSGDPIHTWLSTVSKLRNKVVHGGYRPSEEEAKAALVSMVKVEDHIEHLIGDLPNATKYPFTAYMMLGPVGLTEAGSFTKGIRTTIEGETSDWRRSFYAFRQGVVDEVWNE
jgi:hypothetical protein